MAPLLIHNLSVIRFIGAMRVVSLMRHCRGMKADSLHKLIWV